jgi:hypothetical protein
LVPSLGAVSLVNQQESKIKMPAKKAKKKIKAQDLKPKKDAKGGLIGLLDPNRGQLPAVQHGTGQRPH